MWAIFNICVTTWSSTESQQMFYFADSLKVSSVSFKLFTSARVRMSFSNVIWNHAAGPNKVTSQLQWSFSNLVLEGSLDKSVLPSESHQMKASLQTGCCANIGFRYALMPSYLWKQHFSDFGHIKFFQGHEWDRSTFEFRDIWEDFFFFRLWSCCSSFKCFTLYFFCSVFLIFRSPTFKFSLSHCLSIHSYSVFVFVSLAFI